MLKDLLELKWNTLEIELISEGIDDLYTMIETSCVILPKSLDGSKLCIYSRYAPINMSNLNRMYIVFIWYTP